MVCSWIYLDNLYKFINKVYCSHVCVFIYIQMNIWINKIPNCIRYHPRQIRQRQTDNRSPDYDIHQVSRPSVLYLLYLILTVVKNHWDWNSPFTGLFRPWEMVSRLVCVKTGSSVSSKSSYCLFNPVNVWTGEERCFLHSVTYSLLRMLDVFLTVKWRWKVKGCPLKEQRIRLTFYVLSLRLFTSNRVAVSV